MGIALEEGGLKQELQALHRSRGLWALGRVRARGGEVLLWGVWGRGRLRRRGELLRRSKGAGSRHEEGGIGQDSACAGGCKLGEACEPCLGDHHWGLESLPCHLP